MIHILWLKKMIVKSRLILLDKMETEVQLDTYEELLSVQKLWLYKACYNIYERDSEKGIRITKIDSESGGIARETK